MLCFTRLQTRRQKERRPDPLRKNVFLNIVASAYKLNNDPSGFYIFHNTSARTLGRGNWGAYAFTSLGYTQSDGDPAYAGNFEMKNNIRIGLTEPAYVTTDLILADIDYNGWSPDGAFRFVDNWVNFADLQSNSPYELNGRILSGAIEFGEPMPSYGVRQPQPPSDTMPPATPQNVLVE